jgi:hypothetical protein
MLRTVTPDGVGLSHGGTTGVVSVHVRGELKFDLRGHVTSSLPIWAVMASKSESEHYP